MRTEKHVGIDEATDNVGLFTSVTLVCGDKKMVYQGHWKIDAQQIGIMLTT